MEWVVKRIGQLGEGGDALGAECGGGRGGGVCCLWEVPERCSCQVNVLKCTLEGFHICLDKCIVWKSVPLCYCSGREAQFVVVVGVDICLYLCG